MNNFNYQSLYGLGYNPLVTPPYAQGYMAPVQPSQIPAQYYTPTAPMPQQSGFNVQPMTYSGGGYSPLGNGVAQQGANPNPASKLNYGAGAIGSTALGLVGTIGGLSGLSKMGDRPKYGFNDQYKQSLAMADQLKNQGLSAGERGSAIQDLANSLRSTQQGITNASGGNLSQAVAGQLNANKIGATNQLADISSKIKRDNQRNYQQVSLQQQGMQNEFDKDKINQYDLTKQAYGQAVKNGLEGLAGGINFIGLGL